DSDRPLLDADLQLSGGAPGAAVEFVGHATGQPDVDAPAGSTAIGTSGIALRATVSRARWTVPSPPHSSSRSGSAATAARTASGTFLLFITSRHTTSGWPRRRNSVRSSGRPPPSFFLA